MFTAALSENTVFPTDAEMTALLNYPAARLVAIRRGTEASKNEIQRKIRKINILIGHYPYVLGHAFFDHPKYFTMLRHPIARTLSLIDMHKYLSDKIWPRSPYREFTPDTTYADALKMEQFVENEVRDYQTKVFAANEVPKTLDLADQPQSIDDTAYESARHRLEQVDVIGFCEDFAGAVRRVEEKFGIKFHDQLHSEKRNQWTKDRALAALDDDVLEKITELNKYDLRLYEHALEFAK